MEPITEEEVRRIIENDEQKIQKIIDEGGQVTKTIVENQKQIITTIKIEPVNGSPTSSTIVQNKDNTTIGYL